MARPYKRLEFEPLPIRREGALASVKTDYELDEIWPEIMERYPLIGHLRVSKNAYVRHCRILNGEPTHQQYVEFSRLWADDCSFNDEEIAEAANVTRDEAKAWGYLLSKKGWIQWNKDLQAYVGTFGGDCDEGDDP